MCDAVWAHISILYVRVCSGCSNTHWRILIILLLLSLECQLVFDPPTYKVNENAGSVEVCVKMEKNCIGAFALPLNTADGPNEDRRAVGEY